MRIELVAVDAERAESAPAQQALRGQATLSLRDDDASCRLHATAAMRLNGCPVEDAVLRNGDLLELGDGRRYVVRLQTDAAPPRSRVGLVATLALLGGLLTAGLLLGDRPWSVRDERIDAQVALARGREIERRRYEGRLERVTAQLAEIERRMAPRSTVDEQMGEVRQAVAQVERAMSARIGSEVARSLDTHPDLRAAREALERLESEQRAIEVLLARCSDAVCVIQGAYGFGRPTEEGFEFLREATPEQLAAWEDLGDRLPLVFEGDGQQFTIEFTGTGFLAGAEGIVITNRHIAEPWWKSATAEPLIEQGFEPHFLYLRAFFPGRDAPVDFMRDRTVVADDADLAALSVDARAQPHLPRPLELAVDAAPSIGSRVVLLGYPSGIDALLARADEDEDLVDRYLTPEGLDERGLLDALAARELVRPLPSQGHVSDVLAERILFDAPTALGGSGGPLLDLQGRVVAVNYGILKAFSRANFGVPARRAADLLEAARALHRAPNLTR